MPSRPASQWDPLLLLRVVREVSESAGVEEPAAIAQRPWDLAREQHELWSEAPQAKRVAERIGLSWAKVLEAAFSETRSQGVVLGQMARDRSEDGWFNQDYCIFALALIARRLEAETLRTHEYAAERERMLKEDARYWRHGRHLRLPTSDQIQKVTESWDDALRLAGLSPLPPTPAHRAPSMVELLDRCYEVYGTQPTKRELTAFAHGNGIAFPRRVVTWSVSVAEWKQSLHDRGLSVPDGPPPRGQRPGYADDVGAGLEGERRRTTWDDRRVCVEWVARFLRELLPGQRADIRSYQDWRRFNLGAPTYDTLHRNGGWAAARRDAERLLAETG